jgi:hypothetical protein
MGKYGTNVTGLGAYEGGVNNDKGAPLVANNTDGETSLLFGPSALREIQAGVANGDFAIPPDQATATITEDNPLPYWTFTDVNSAGAITCAVVADATAGSGNVLRFTIASGTTTGKSVTLTRFIPVPASASRSFCFYAEATFENATNSNQGGARLEGQYYKADQTTTTGSAWDSGIYTFDFLATAGTKGITAPDLYIGTSIAPATAPSDAAFVKLTITISSRIATASADRTIDLTEVRLANGLPELLLTDKDAPGTYQPAFIASRNGTLTVKPSVGLSLPNTTVSQYDKGGSSDSTTITTAGTYYALTNAEVSFSPQFEGQRWLLTFTGYASLNTTTIQYCFVRANVVTTANVNIVDLGFSRADNFGTSGRGATVAFTKVYVATAADVTAGTRKFKLYGTVQTTNGLNLSLAYTQMTAYPIG